MKADPRDSGPDEAFGRVLLERKKAAAKEAEEQHAAEWWESQPKGFQPSLGLSGCILIPKPKRQTRLVPFADISDVIVENPLHEMGHTILEYPDWIDRCCEPGLRHTCDVIFSQDGALTSYRPEDSPGSVYFIQDESNGHIKIGRTGGQLQARLNALQTGCSGRLRIWRANSPHRQLNMKHRPARRGLRGPDIAAVFQHRLPA